MVNLYHGGKTQSNLCKEYGVSQTTISRWITLYSEVQVESGEPTYCEASERTSKIKSCFRRGESYLKNSNCHIHATLHQRLRAIFLLQSEHTVSKLCRVLKVNSSTFYKYNNRKPSNCFLENQELKRLILQIYTETNYRSGAAKIQILLQREYDISISIVECTV